MSPSSAPLLSVVIVTYNTAAILRRCLDALADALDGIGHEVIIVDNDSTDGTRELIRGSYAGLVLICNSENKGFAKAVNQGIRRSNGKYVLLLNSDVFLTPESLRQVLALMESSASTGVISPQLVNADGSWQKTVGFSRSKLSQVANLFYGSFLLDAVNRLRFRSCSAAANPAPAIVRYHYLSGACMLLRRSTLDRVGLLDESFFFYSEDEDLCVRVRSAGFKVALAPGVRVVHLRGGSSSGKEKYLAIHVESERTLLRKYNYTDLQVRVLYLSRLLKSLVSYLVLNVLGVFVPRYREPRALQRMIFKKYYGLIFSGRQ